LVVADRAFAQLGFSQGLANDLMNVAFLAFCHRLLVLVLGKAEDGRLVIHFVLKFGGKPKGDRETHLGIVDMVWVMVPEF
jgi:hypothetical protein